jgi:hypothetical protein
LEKLKKPDEEAIQGPRVVTKQTFRDLAQQIQECETQFQVLQKQAKMLRVELSRA